MSEKTERRIVTAAAALLVAVMVAFGVHQYFELKQLDRENYAKIRCGVEVNDCLESKGLR